MKKIISLIGVVAVAVLGYFGYEKYEEMNFIPTAVLNDETTNTEETIKTETPATPKNYKDGKYSLTIKYNTPAGFEDLGVNLELSKNKIIAATVTKMGRDGTSSNFQSKFISDFSSYVIGQDIENLKLKVTSGASLTTGGFNNALNQIRAQAVI